MTASTYQLIMRSGPTPEKVYDLIQPVLFIGRDFANEIVINDPEVSRRHARLTAQTGGYILEDTGSTNGTFVNGQRLLGPHLLRPGELISFGGSVLLSYEALQFDSNATLAAPVNLPPYQAPASSYDPAYTPPAGQAPQVAYPQSSQPARQTYSPSSAQPPVQAPPAYYSGQIPQNPPEVEAPEAKKSSSRGWILLSIGCFLVFLCVCVGVGYVFDSLNLYCMAPFNSLLSWLYTCP